MIAKDGSWTLALMVAMAAVSLANAQGTYPTKPVRFINPVAAGGVLGVMQIQRLGGELKISAARECRRRLCRCSEDAVDAIATVRHIDGSIVAGMKRPDRLVEQV